MGGGEEQEGMRLEGKLDVCSMVADAVSMCSVVAVSIAQRRTAQSSAAPQHTSAHKRTASLASSGVRKPARRGTGRVLFQSSAKRQCRRLFELTCRACAAHPQCACAPPFAQHMRAVTAHTASEQASTHAACTMPHLMLRGLLLGLHPRRMERRCPPACCGPAKG